MIYLKNHTYLFTYIIFLISKYSLNLIQYFNWTVYLIELFEYSYLCVRLCAFEILVLLFVLLIDQSEWQHMLLFWRMLWRKLSHKRVVFRLNSYLVSPVLIHFVPIEYFLLYRSYFLIHSTQLFFLRRTILAAIKSPT